MEKDGFKDLFTKIVEEQRIEPRVAEMLLQRILQILKKQYHSSDDV